MYHLLTYCFFGLYCNSDENNNKKLYTTLFFYFLINFYFLSTFLYFFVLSSFYIFYSFLLGHNYLEIDLVSVRTGPGNETVHFPTFAYGRVIAHLHTSGLSSCNLVSTPKGQ